MDIHFRKDYKSIKSQEAITNLPDFFVLSGKNGSGKTHLLEGVSNGSFMIDNISPENILHFNYLNFYVSENKNHETKDKEEKLLEYRANKETRFNEITQLVITSKIDGWGRDTNSFSKNASILNIHPLVILMNFIKEHFCYRDVFDESMYNKIELEHGGNSAILTKFHNYKEIMDFIKRFLLGNIMYIETVRIEMLYGLPIEQIQADQIPYDIPFLKQELMGDITSWYKKFNDKRYEAFIKREEEITIENYKPEELNPLTDINFYLEVIGYNGYRLEVINKYIEDMGKYQDYTANLVITDPKNNITIGFEDLSSGEKILFGLAVFMARNQNISKRVLLLDEIDANLHPSIVKEVLNHIKVFCVDNMAMKVIMTTHSPNTVSFAENVCIINKDKTPSVEEVEHEIATKELSGGIPLLNSGIDIYNNTSDKKLNIISEGRNYKYIEKAISLINPDLSNKVNFPSGLEDITSKQQLVVFYKHLNIISPKNKYLIVFDCDADKECKKITETDFIKSFIFKENENNLIIKSGIENLFDENKIPQEFFAHTTQNGTEYKNFSNASKSDLEKHMLINGKNKDFEPFNDLIKLIKDLTD